MLDKTIQADLKQDQAKMPWDKVPMEFLHWIAEVMVFGAAKYEWDNWKKGESHRYSNAAFRHMIHHIEEKQAGVNNPLDESGLPALAHVATSSLMCLWLQKKENETKTNKNPSRNTSTTFSRRLMDLQSDAQRNGYTLSILKSAGVPEKSEDSGSECVQYEDKEEGGFGIRY